MEEAINDEQEARRVAEEERRERKRHDGREISSRESDKGRQKKSVASESSILVTERDQSPDRERVIKREKKREVEAEEGRKE